MDSAVRWLRMVTDEAKNRGKILAFWKTYGLAATMEAHGVSRRTLYGWKERLDAAQGKPEALNPGSRAPNVRRKRSWPVDVTEEIRRVREEHPNLGKEKAFVHLQAFCQERGLVCPSVRTIGRIIADARDKMRTFPKKVRHDGTIVRKDQSQILRKPKKFKAEYPGHCVAFDTIEFHVWGSRVYVITMVDLYSRFAVALVTNSHASKAAAEFFRNVRRLFPHPITSVLTDNGSEFMRHFDEALRHLHQTHWRTYPRTPKMNAHCERFNRTIQDEFFLDHHHLLGDRVRCNAALTAWLNWYNLERPHWSLNLRSPMAFLAEYGQTLKNTEECKM